MELNKIRCQSSKSLVNYKLIRGGGLVSLYKLINKIEIDYEKSSINY